MVNTQSIEERLDRLEKAVANIKVQMSTFEARISNCINDALAPFLQDLQSRGFIRERRQQIAFTLDDQSLSHTNNTKSHNFNTEPTPSLLPLAPNPPPTSPLVQEIQPVQQPVTLPRLDAPSIPANQHLHKFPITQPNVALSPSISQSKLLALSPLLIVRPVGAGHPSSLMFSSPNSTCAFSEASCRRMTTKHLEYEWLLASPTRRISKQCINVVGRSLLIGNLDSLRKHEYEPPPIKAMCLCFNSSLVGKAVLTERQLIEIKLMISIISSDYFHYYGDC
ncbi:uncharacterized protein LOC121784886 [Salvia splendens]|uniref:uncharacterized protein LOC121784886 n=1 Tax=Salvia splendens TaxID=180675 RepID=UPI001C25DDC3|nr:uncharacterized protein LOC121784886 [Salvia splendens]